MKLEPLENEKWVWAKTFKYDYSDEYLVSDMGRCWSIRNEKFLGRWHNDHWYVTLSKNGKEEYLMIGRLALISFNIPIPEHLKDLPTNKVECMHLDGDSHNNNLSNFTWGSRLENQNEENCRRRKSEAVKGNKNHFYGKHHSEEAKRKISKTKGKHILQYSLSGEFIREWDSIMDVQRELGINNGNISQCARGKIYKSCGGYVWRYKEEVA